MPSIMAALSSMIEILLVSDSGAFTLASEPQLVSALLGILRDVDDGAKVDGASPEASDLPNALSDGADNSTCSPATPWAVRSRQCIISATKAAHSFSRLLNGDLGSLHALLTLEPSCGGDHVATLLSSPAGMGILAACLQPSRLSAEYGSTNALYAAALLERVLLASNGALVCIEHGVWLRQLIKALQSAGPRDDALSASLLISERALQPTLFMLAHGHEALANAVGLLLSEGDANEPTLVSFDAELVDSSALEHISDFTVKYISAGGDSLTERLRRTALAHAPTLTTCLRALRAAAVRQEVALSLHEVDALDWLRVILCIGHSVLRGSCSNSTGERELLWLLEAAVGVVHLVLWQLAQSDLAEYHDTALFESLCRLCMALPLSPSLTSTYQATRCNEHAIAPHPGSIAEATHALELELLSTLGLFWEGRWPSRVPHLLEKMADITPSEGIGAVLLLACSIPPPLPVAPECLADAALLALPPSGTHHAKRSWAIAISADGRLAAGPNRISASPASKDDNAAPERVTMPVDIFDESFIQPMGIDALQHALLEAMLARRERWRSLLSDAGPEIQRLVTNLLGCSCRCALKGLAELLTRLIDLLPSAGVHELVQPLLQLAIDLGRCTSGERSERPLTARGDPLAATRRVALLLASLATRPPGRTALITSDSSLLAAALAAILKAPDTLARRTGMVLLRSLCCEELSMPARPAKPLDKGILLPPLAVLGPAVAIVADLSEDQASGCEVHARSLLSCLQTILSEATHQHLRELGHALATSDPIAALHAMAADFALGSDEGERELKAEDGARLAIWPQIWQQHKGCAAELDALVDSSHNEYFGTGLVSTELYYAQFVGTEAKRGKRSHADVELSDRGDAPPPVRGGRGRMREDNPPPRGKANTSRPASKHVDDYQQLGVKRFANSSSRAPSKHVDDYQQAPVVRKTMPQDGRKPGDESGAGEGQPLAPPTQPFNGTPGGCGGGAGQGMAMCGGQLNMQMLQQQLGMAAAVHGMPADMLAMQRAGGMGAGMPMMGGCGMMGGMAMGAMPGMGMPGMPGMGNAGGAAGCGPCGGGGSCGRSAPPSISPEQLQQLMQDEGKLQQFLADHPSMSKEIMRMMGSR